MSKSIAVSIALRTPSDRYPTLIAALILSLLATYTYGSLINAITVLALHHQNIITLTSSFGIPGVIIGHIATSWLIAQAQMVKE